MAVSLAAFDENGATISGFDKVDFHNHLSIGLAVLKICLSSYLLVHFQSCGPIGMKLVWNTCRSALVQMNIYLSWVGDLWNPVKLFVSI